jgi:lipoate-protein ligase A
MAPLFDRLCVWYDEQARSGAENMALDQLLLEGAQALPMLRVYHWSEPTVSLGYFQPLMEARKAFAGPDVTYVRRWTGGGVVDHRIDVTYTLVMPRKTPLARMRGAQSYCEIHAVLAKVLNELGHGVGLATSDRAEGGVACFKNPVAFDITDKAGNKLAGAGQRRCKFGLLHQGSVVTRVGSAELFDRLVRHMGAACDDFSPADTLLRQAVQLATKRYASESWLNKR